MMSQNNALMQQTLIDIREIHFFQNASTFYLMLFPLPLMNFASNHILSIVLSFITDEMKIWLCSYPIR